MLKIFRKRPQQQSDAELITLYQKSADLEVLGVLYERYVELVYGVCLKYLKNPTLAEDAVMNIYEELVVKVKKHQIDNFRGWLSVVSRNHCLMQLRKKNIEVSYDPQLMYSEEVVHPTFGEQPDNKAHKALHTCIETLSAEQKQCVKWFYLEEKSYKDIAQMSNLTLGKVRSYIQNGRRNLRICMDKKSKK